MTTPTDNTVPLHRQLREARRRAALTQAALAARVGCMQSAVSMMETGRMDALARPTLEKIAEVLGVALPREFAVEGQVATLPPARMRLCPSPDCPSNLPYQVGGDVLFLPRATGASGPRCPLCGEVLTSDCSACGAPAVPCAACCTACGQPLVAAPPELLPDPATWVAERQRRAQAVAAWGA